MPNKEKNTNYCYLIIITGLILGIAVAASFYAGIVTSIAALFYITLIVGILGLIFVIFTLLCSKREKCKCIDNSCLISGVVGAIISGAFGIASIATAAAASIPAAIIVGAVAFFLHFSVVNILKAFACLTCGSGECCK